MAQTVDERLERIKVLDREIAAVPDQMKALRDGEAGKRSEREKLVAELREEMGDVLHLRKVKATPAPAAKPGRPAGSPTRAPNEAAPVATT